MTLSRSLDSSKHKFIHKIYATVNSNRDCFILICNEAIVYDKNYYLTLTSILQHGLNSDLLDRRTWSSDEIGSIDVCHGDKFILYSNSFPFSKLITVEVTRLNEDLKSVSNKLSRTTSNLDSLHEHSANTDARLLEAERQLREINVSADEMVDRVGFYRTSDF
ncbi:unnamed protein product [Protopolystoma xenopodis]|uniref:Uncharacterized protein n=1 Tax=Protopolystoma xenopodis TaxID=117903 RepID=A0A3S5FD81_9PLAT|nr:unnamed protein product [Protopolystoma xenopodis]